jgi:hypothetical protein
MSQTFHFDGYTVRPVEPRDRIYLGQLIQSDAHHREKVDPDFFMNPLPGESCWALEDASGQIVFYFKNSPVIRMHIQFTDRRRQNMSGLLKGLAWIEGIFRASLFREIIFDVDGPELQAFAKRRLGFVDARNLLSRMIAPFDTPNIQPEDLGTVPTNNTGREG